MCVVTQHQRRLSVGSVHRTQYRANGARAAATQHNLVDRQVEARDACMTIDKLELRCTAATVDDVVARAGRERVAAGCSVSIQRLRSAAAGLN